MTYHNPNKGLTKAHLEKQLNSVGVGYYIAQYGHGWPLDTLRKFCQYYLKECKKCPMRKEANETKSK
jgi:hypothetical protein